MKLGLNMEESLGMDGFLRARGLGRSCSIGALGIDIGELLRWSVWIWMMIWKETLRCRVDLTDRKWISAHDSRGCEDSLVEVEGFWRVVLGARTGE